MSEVKYPEAEKWGKVHDGAVAIIGFEDWKQYQYPEGTMKSTQTLVYEYYDIDEEKLEDERRAMIEALNG